jgi:hypothetical protein
MKKLDTRIKPSQLQTYYKANGADDVTMEECSRIIQSLKLGHVSQLIFDFGIVKIQIIVDLLEEEEEYEALTLIRDKVKIHNKVTKNKFNIKKDA